MRTFGVEEELLLVDGAGHPLPLAEQVLGGSGRRASGDAELTIEMQQEMVEAVTGTHSDTAALLGDVVRGRRHAEEAATRFGAHAVALAASPLPVNPHVTGTARYRGFVQRYGRTARDSLTCGFHVHVFVESPEEGVAVLDRIRTWLPSLLALSGNSAIVDGGDTGYESFRFEAWNRWPLTGPTPVFGSVAAYRAFEQRLLDTGVLIDQGMLYLDARLSRTHPTVEVRVADVCLLPVDAVTIAAVVRGLVETASREWRAAIEPDPVDASVLRLATWRSALSGLRGELVDPITLRPARADGVIRSLYRHIADAVEDAGDGETVRRGLSDIVRRGTGSTAQRTSLARRGDPADVVRDAIGAGLADVGRARESAIGASGQLPLGTSRTTRMVSSDGSAASGITMPAASPVRR